jgi:mannose/fructose-specific phosphotransferase system component IIA
MSKLKGVVLSHALLAQALVRAVDEITGEGAALVPVSNEGCGLALLEERLEAAAGGAPCLLFVDLPGGSCLQAAARYLREHPECAAVSGVNLAMLVDFVYHRDLSAAEAARRALETGNRALRLIQL